LTDRLTGDLLSISTPTGFTEGRRMKLGAVVAARAQCAARPRWMAIFVKACALVAEDIPELRRVYLPFPRPHFYEYPTSVAFILLGREQDGEMIYFNHTIRDPASLPLVEIDRRITHAITRPMEEVREFRRAWRFARLPTPLRRFLIWVAHNIGRQRPKYFGTFTLTVHTPGRVSGLFLAGTSRFSYARFQSDGSIDVRVAVDHRVMDWATPDRILARMEDLLNGPIAEELRAVSGG
jgi:hypothetical protein